MCFWSSVKNDYWRERYCVCGGKLYHTRNGKEKELLVHLYMRIVGVILKLASCHALLQLLFFTASGFVHSGWEKSKCKSFHKKIQGGKKRHILREGGRA